MFGKYKLVEKNPFKRVLYFSLFFSFLLGLWEFILIGTETPYLPKKLIGKLSVILIGFLTNFVFVFLFSLIIHIPFWLKKYKIYIKISLLLPTLILATIIVIKYTKPYIKVYHSIKGKTENILLITLDTLRQDYVGVYGNNWIKTPFLDRFSKRSYLFTEGFANVPMTTPSHASILTGKVASRHGARSNAYRLHFDNFTLAEALTLAGYENLAFVSCFPLKRKFQLYQGFKVYDDQFFPHKGYNDLILIHFIEKLLNRRKLERNATALNNAVKPYLKRLKGKRYFLWLHYFDPHADYNPPYPYNRFYDDVKIVNLSKVKKKFTLKRIKEVCKVNDVKNVTLDLPLERYAGEISFLDRALEKIFYNMESVGLLKNTTIFIVADHGEAFGEHNETFSHGLELYDEQIRIPYLIKFARNNKGKIIDKLVRLYDIYPTVIELLLKDLKGKKEDKILKKRLVSLLKNIDGKSLIGLINNKEKKERYVFIENYGVELFKGAKRLKGIRTVKYKFIQFEKDLGKDCLNAELYDIENDPYELYNRCEELKDVRKDLKDKMMLEIKRVVKDKLPSDLLIDKETIENLKELGYIK